MTTKTLKPIYPDEVLREEFIEPLGMSRRAFAKKIIVPASRLNDIVPERRGITADTALRLSKALGTTAEFWMNLQSYYDLDVARDDAGEQVEREVDRCVYLKCGSNFNSLANPELLGFSLIIIGPVSLKQEDGAGRTVFEYKVVWVAFGVRGNSTSSFFEPVKSIFEYVVVVKG